MLLHPNDKQNWKKWTKIKNRIKRQQKRGGNLSLGIKTRLTVLKSGEPF